MDLEKTNQQLKDELVVLGMPQSAVDKIPSSKAILVPMIEALTSKQSVSETVPEENTPVEKVATLNPTPNPIEEKKVEKSWKTKSQAMRELVMGQLKDGKVGKILIPLNGSEKKGEVSWKLNPRTNEQEQVYTSGAIQSVILNGFQYIIPKGVYVEVPERISEKIEKSFQQTTDAGATALIDRIDPETGKSVRDRL